ncbi:ferredoxin [Thermopolyspora sp. NPDC052614]|uniref:ferredoxin n=1 Tax=Thermopolyspora sp. NPDC052614 TaxID=3155682 RepID=UPI0034186324
MGRIIADRDRCIGAGRCAYTAPELFDSGDDGLVWVLDPEPSGERVRRAREAVRLCPVGALALDESDGAGGGDGEGA